MRIGRPVCASILSILSGVSAVRAASLLPLRFTHDPVPALLAAPPEGEVRASEWPTGPDARSAVVLTRHDIYAPDARIYSVHGTQQIELPRSRLRFLWGAAEDADHTAVLVVIDPDSSELHGYSRIDGRWAEVRRRAGSETEYVLDLDPASSAADLTGERPRWSCADGPDRSASGEEPEVPRSLAAPESVSALRRATLAVDTDNELLLLKFSDNTAAATNYIATLVALMSSIYERDLQVRTLQGTTFLRVSTTPDPYVQSSGGNADSAKLNELKNWWIAHQSGVARAAVMMLSGKQSEPYSGSGFAFINGLCSTTSGYSFSQVFKFPGSTAADDVKLVAHEVGHNFGSPHTHCYSPPIDTCYSGQSGCYSGATSCPAATTINGVPNVRGTLMSYCHALGGCSSSTVFHPRTVDRIAPIVASKVGVCIFDVATPQEASPAHDMRAQRGSGGVVNVTYAPACGATGHTVYAGTLAMLRTIGISWNQRFCAQGATGSLSFNPGSSNVYFVVVGNSGTVEGSYGRGSAGERPSAGAGGACSYTLALGGTCP